MGIIKLKNANDEQAAENAALEEQQAYKLAVEAQVGAELPQEEHEQWDDPAVLHEDETRTDENSRHYVLNNGTAKSVFNAEPVSFFDEEEKKWKHIDNSLEEKEDAFETKSGKFKTRISKVHKGKKVAISKSDKQLSWEYLGKQVAAVANENVEDIAETVLKVNNGTQGVAKHINSSAIYENIEKDTDLEYCLLGNNLKENIIVKEKSADYRYLFALKTEGLKLRLSDDNESLELYTEKEKEDGTVEQKVEFTIPSPYMYDANGVASDDVYYELEPSEDGKFAFAVVANEEWVNAADRAFPVTIDPQVVTNNSSLVTKQVQYRIVSSGSGSGSSVGSWTNTSYSDIKVYKDDYIEYRTRLTIKRGSMNLPNNRICSVKLILTPSTTFSGSLYVNNYYHSYNSNEGKLEQDITNIFKSYTTGDFNIYVEPYYYGYINGYFSMSANPPVIEIEYLTNENTRETKKSFTLADIGTGEVDLATGDMTTSFCDIPAENSVMGLSIVHVYKKSAEKYLLGDNFRLNLHEMLVKNGNGALDTDYIYTDAKGDKHGFNEHYYYINTSGKKVYVTAAKTNITVEADGTLKYGGYEVFVEYKSATGLKAMPQLEGFNNVEWLEQRSDELKQNEEKLKGYQSALNEFVVINKNTGDSVSKLKNPLITIPAFETFINKANNSANIVLMESETINYRSLLLQKETYTATYTDGKIVPNENEINKNILSIKSSLYETKVAIQNALEEVNFDNKATILDLLATSESIDLSLCPEEASSSENEEETVPLLSVQSQIRQRNLLLEQLQQQTDSLEEQLALVNEQITALQNKKSLYIEQIKSYYKEYRALVNEQEQIKEQMPVNFLTDGKIIKGYNEAGRLVAVYDMYENYAVIEYEKYYVASKSGYRIARVYDNKNQQIIFTYTPQNYLSSITDTRGRRTEYAYDDTKLARVTYATGEEMMIAYYGNDIMSIWETKKDLRTELNRSGNKLMITQKTRTENTELSAAEITFTQNSDLSMNYATIKEEKTRERYYFNGDRNCREYRLEENGVVTKAEQYEYVPYWNGTTAQTDPRSVRKTAKKTGLYQATLEAYTFPTQASDYNQETTTLDQFNNAKQTTTSALQMNASGSNMQTTVVDYTYDDNQKLVEEKTTVTYIAPAKTFVSYKKYTYNAMGDIVRKESYVEGEEYTTGKTIEETVYDEKGNVIKSYTYNSLDTSSKFYTETEYDENGKTVAKYDETGENKKKYEYVAGTSVVGEETLANGSKFAYGREMDDTVTAISQSTEEGEENSTQKVYKHGLVAELRSGNNVVQYTYDNKRRLSSVNLNGTENYVTNVYTVVCDESCLYEYDEVETTNANGESVTLRKDKRGNVLSKTYSDGRTLVYDYAFDKGDQLKSVTESKNGSEVRVFGYTYDGLDKVLTYTEKENGTTKVTETYTYDEYGNVQTATQSTGMVYGYTYKTDSTRALESVVVNGVTFKPQTDVLGRNKGKQIHVNNAKIAEENIVYRKVGDHATNMPASVYFGAYKAGRYALNEHLKYAYDEMGNIVSVKENGELVVRYAYDKLSRLVREDNKTFGKTWLYTYDNNGNILCKRETEFTLKTNVEECTFTKNAYTYDGDKLLTYNEEICEYDSIGNPKKYRGKAATWERGRQLISYDGHTFTYDAQGRRLTKDSVSFTYDSSGRLIKQSNGLEFFYDHTGVAGVKYDNKTYVYRKDVQGNIIALLDSNGIVVVKYVYDGWGNHGIEVVDSACETIANLNPFRYRSYYFDTETELYFLKTRYYDPEIGRFMTIDGIEYLNPDTINGLNLYAYCGNNPVMGYDPEGTWDWGRFWRGLIIVVVAVAAIALTVVTLGSGSALGAVIIAGTIGIAGEMFSQTVFEGKTFSEINYLQVAISGIASAISAIPGVGYLGGILVSGAAGAVSSLVDGKSWGEAALNGLKSAAITGIAGGLARGIGLFKIAKVGNGNYASKKVFLNHTGIKDLATFNPAINKSQSFMKYIFQQTGFKGVSKLANDTAGWGITTIIDVISAIFP